MNDEFTDLFSQSFAEPSEQAVFRTLVARHPIGFERALDERCLMSWLRVRAERSRGPDAGLARAAVHAVRSAWNGVDDDAAAATCWYDAWHAARLEAHAVLRRTARA